MGSRVGGGGADTANGSGPAGLIGRTHELSRITESLEVATSGHGCVWLVVGEPGIGKSRLLDAVGHHAGRESFQVRWGRCWEDGGAPLFWPWTEIVRDGASAEDLQAMAASIGSAATHLAALVPEFAPDAPSPDPEAEGAHAQLFDAVLGLLRHAGETRPQLVLLDDLHAADGGTIKLLAYLAPRLRDLPIVVCAAYRGPELDAKRELEPHMFAVQRHAGSLRLAGLSADELAALALAEIGRPLDDDMVRLLHQQTGGNPLFAATAIRGLTAGADPAFGPGSNALDRFQSMMRIRLHNLLDEEVAEVLRVATVLGREFEVGLLARMAEARVEDVVSALGRCVDIGVIAPVGDSPFAFRFGHDLVRDALYSALPPVRRMHLHRQAALALESHHGTGIGVHVTAVAHHLFQAGPLTDADRAVDYHVRAADRAQELAAYDEAERYLHRALSLLDGCQHPTGRQRAEIAVRVGNVRNRAGLAEGARESFLRAAELARGDANAVGVLADAAVGYGRETLASGSVDPVLVELLEEALMALDQGDDRRWIEVATRLAIELYYAPGPAAQARRATLAQVSVDRAESLGDPKMLSYAIEASILATSGPDNVRERLAAGRRIIELADAAGRREGRQGGHVWRAAALLELGDVAGFEAELERYEELAAELRQPAHLWYVEMLKATHRLLTGPLDLAVELADAAAEIGRMARNDEASDYHVMQRWTAAWLRSDHVGLATAVPALRDLARRQTAIPAFAAALACTHLALGDEADGRREVTALLSRDPATAPRNLAWLAFVCLLGEAVSLLGDRASADTLYPLLVDYEDHVVVLDWSIAPLGTAGLYLCLLAIARGDLDTAERHLDRATTVLESVGAVPWGERAAALRSRLAPSEQTRERGGDHAPPMTSTGVMRRDGDYWSISFGEETIKIRHLYGLAYLSTLLSEPGREFHVLDLIAVIQGRAVPALGAAATADDLAIDIGLGDAGSILDAKAKAAYRQRMLDLQEDIEEANVNNDPERRARAQQEVDFLTRELTAAVGLGGRDRKAASSAERARVSVTKAIRTALTRVADAAPALGEHLSATVRTGYFCAYVPDPRAPIDWEI